MWLFGGHLQVLKDDWSFQSDIIIPKSEHANQSCARKDLKMTSNQLPHSWGGGGGQVLLYCFSEQSFLKSSEKWTSILLKYGKRHNVTL